MDIRDRFNRVKNTIIRKFRGGLNFHRRRRRFRADRARTLGIYIGALVGVILLAFIISFSFFTTVKMGGVSMEPTIKDDTNVLINKWYIKPSYNNIIAFEKVDNENDYTYIKRIVALPGDTVKISNGKLYVNDKKYSDVSSTAAIDYEGIAEDKITLEDDQYFVLGDNRNNSEDSRYQSIGLISKSQMKGRVWFKVSFGDFGIVN